MDSLGWYYFVNKEYTKALTELLRAEVLINNEGGDPDPVIHDHIARAYFHSGDRKRAVEYMQDAVALDPENEEFKKRLAQFKKALSSSKKPAGKPKPNPKAKSTPAKDKAA